MKLPLRAVVEMLGRAVESDAVVTGWSVDSRTLQPGDLFFALRGPNHDGHAHIGEALRRGAVAVVAEDLVAEAEFGAGVILRVEDSLKALQALAARVRQKWAGDVVGVTGSAGKTTTKDVIADMLAAQIKTTKTVGNLNNHVGLPLSLLRLDEAARVAVLEMGMNHSGEIRELAEIAKPNAGVVTNVGYAHIENFESIEEIALAKRELIDALPDGGTAVLNADDPRVAAFAVSRPGPSLLYGQSAGAQVRGEDVEYSDEGVRFRVGSAHFESVLTGSHNVSNILAGIAVAGVYGISPESLVEQVRQLQPGKMRGERFEHDGIIVFNDCYNSNPDAVHAMLEVLTDTPARRRIAVLGEMLELGRWSEALHREIGAYAAKRGIDLLIGVRGAAAYMLDAAKQAGLRPEAVLFFEDPSAAGQAVRVFAQHGDAILFKGSRGVHIERALAQFLAPPEGSGN
jgi:UDP-N-acetylmuramoyl-tripeptide--D-alanyl-D-alanine ligase